MLPTEHELAERFGVSRFTVREAIRRLNELGLVSRHQGVGTRVVAAQIAGRYVLSLAAIPDLWRFVEATTLKVLRKKLIKAERRGDCRCRRSKATRGLRSRGCAWGARSPKASRFADAHLRQRRISRDRGSRRRQVGAGVRARRGSVRPPRVAAASGDHRDLRDREDRAPARRQRGFAGALDRARVHRSGTRRSWKSRGPSRRPAASRMRWTSTSNFPVNPLRFVPVVRTTGGAV